MVLDGLIIRQDHYLFPYLEEWTMAEMELEYHYVRQARLQDLRPLSI